MAAKKLNEQLENALNKQINAELWSAYLYQSMAVHFAAEGYLGFANWFNVQAREEQDHAKIFMNYIISRGGRVELMPIDKVDTSWKSPLDALEDTLEHEQKVTAMIHNLYATASEIKDFATVSALKWFIDEQVEEEESVQEIIDKLKLINNNGAGLYMLDTEYGARTYAQASPLTGKLIN